MKRATTIAPGRIVVEDIADPAPATGEVVIDVEAAGICGSDFHIYEGARPNIPFPQVQGHEVVGIIRQVGSDTTADVPIGTRVVVEPLVSCGACFACTRGFENCCSSLRVLGVHLPGGFAERMIVDANRVHDVGDLEPDVAVLIEPFSIAIQAVSRARVAADNAVVVMGAGSIGRSIVLAAHDRGARVLVADRQPARLEFAAQLGATCTVNTSREDLMPAIQRFADVDGAPIVIEATGAPSVIRMALDVVAPSGTVVVVGVSDENVSIPINLLTHKEVNLHGSRNSRGAFPEAVQLVCRHRDMLRPAISHRFPLSETERGIRFARDHPATVRKAIIDLRSR